MFLALSLITCFCIDSGGASITVGSLPTFAHGVSGTLIFDSPTQLRIVDFNYDGQGPDTYLYYFRPGMSANRNGGGVFIPLPSPYGVGANGKFVIGRRYTGETLTVTMPAGMTVCDIGTFTVWCKLASTFFTTLSVPRSTFSSTGNECSLNVGSDEPTEAPTFSNCEFLSSSLRLQWSVVNENSIDYKICGCRAMNLQQNQYMGFGLSGSNMRTEMVGADASIAWVDSETGMASAQDYYLTARSPCRVGTGVCPDVMAGRSCSDEITAVSGSQNNREQCVLFTRPLTTVDECDIALNSSNMEQYIVWAIGGLGETAFVHFSRADATTPPLHLGRAALDECRERTLTCESCPPFEGQQMTHREATTFSFTIGPSGVERGYMAITGQAGWGIAWYVNGTLIPELVLQRGVTYTFIVEGGTESNGLARYHPLYITSSSNGGRLSNAQIDEDEVVYAGLDAEDNPTAAGRLCELTETDAATNIKEGCGDLDSYMSELETNCEDGEPGVFTWTPDDDTPDTVYYQCGTHMNLGWRIQLGGGLSSIKTGSFLTVIVNIVLSIVLL